MAGGPTKFGPYVLDARIAVGGTAEVYLAHKADEPGRIIVKRLLPHFMEDPEGRTMFEREAALHASVRHDHVVTVYESGMAGEEPYLAMEYVDGVDVYRLLRRLNQHGKKLPLPLAGLIIRDTLRGLASIHQARDQAGNPLGIVHRDITPSNIYLSHTGVAKVGDFGIARSSSRTSLRNAQSAVLKGKFSYLAPEQVAGESFDHRADLFSVAVVLSEMLLGKQLFAGTGQLAVLLAIRDCRLEPLHEARASIPSGLFDVLLKALAREPSHRFASARDLEAALASFFPVPERIREELGNLVRWVQVNPSTDNMAAVRDAIPQKAPAIPNAMALHADDEDSRRTGEYTQIPSYVLTSRGGRLGPWQFARLVEAMAIGEIGRGDRVDYLGRGFLPIEQVEDLARFLPPTTAPTDELVGVGIPDFMDDVSVMALLRVFLRIYGEDLTCTVFVDTQETSPQRPPRKGDSERVFSGRKELYFRHGKLVHVSSNNAEELLGRYLIRRGAINSHELEFALAVLPKYGGRMGDTLIALGLVNPVDMFRAIREQGRDRVSDLFLWADGKISLFSGHPPPQVAFPLELDIPSLLVAGLEASQPDESPMAGFRRYLDAILGPSPEPNPKLYAKNWPPMMQSILQAVQRPHSLREVLAATHKAGEGSPSDVLRNLQVLLAAKLVSWQ